MASHLVIRSNFKDRSLKTSGPQRADSPSDQRRSVAPWERICRGVVPLRTPLVQLMPLLLPGCAANGFAWPAGDPRPKPLSSCVSCEIASDLRRIDFHRFAPAKFVGFRRLPYFKARWLAPLLLEAEVAPLSSSHPVATFVQFALPDCGCPMPGCGRLRSPRQSCHPALRFRLRPGSLVRIAAALRRLLQATSARFPAACATGSCSPSLRRYREALRFGRGPCP